MVRSRTPWPTQTNSSPDWNRQQGSRSALEWHSSAVHGYFKALPMEARHKPESDDESMMKVWNQFQTNWKLREERRPSNGIPPVHSHNGGHASTSDLPETTTRFSHPASPYQYQDADFVNTFDAGQSRVTSQQYQQNLSHPSSSSLPPNYGTHQARYSQRVYEGHRGPPYHPLSLTPAVRRSGQDRSGSFATPSHTRDFANNPTHQSPTEPLPDPSTQNLRGLTRRPRVQISRKRVSRVRGRESNSVDLEVPQVTEMDYSVMSVCRPNADGSGSSITSRFVPPSNTTRPVTIGSSVDGVYRQSPSQRVKSETRLSRSRIKAREGAESVFADTHLIPKKEPYTRFIPSLMNDMEEEWPWSSPVSTPKAPPLDQQPVIREDLQGEGERLISGCLTDPRISFREAAAVERRKSCELVRSTCPLGVSHLEGHGVPANKRVDEKQPRQQALFQELHHMLEPAAHLDSSHLRSRVEVRRDEKLGEGIIRRACAIEEESIPGTPRGAEGAEQNLHVDVLLAQRVVREAMQEDEECLDQSCMLSASECEEELTGSDSDWQECGLDRKHSTRSVFDWGYA